MKQMIWLILIPLALVSVLLTGGAANRPYSDTDVEVEVDGSTDPGDGYTKDASNPNAPKTIQLKQIIEFSCWFSTVDDAEPGVLGNHIYQLKAKLVNGAVKGSYKVRDKDEERSFRKGHKFLNEIYELVDRYEITQLNGHNIKVKGLPGEYGVNMDIRFASGEHLYVYDNQDCVLPYDFMSEVVKLFENGAAVTPTALNFSVATDYRSDEVNGGWAEVSYPVYTLGCLTSEGDLVQPDGYSALAEAVMQINDAAAESASAAWDCFGTASQEQKLHVLTETFVTRTDSEVISFYERTRRYEDEDQQNEYIEIKTHNLDARTGKELKFSDVFRNMEYLPSLLLMEFEKAYPGQTFYDEALDFIRQSVESDDGNICFALGYGCVHIFADEYVLNDVPGGQHITLSYVLNPDQVKAWYTIEPKRWITPLDYDTIYWRSDISTGFQMHSFVSPEGEDVLWVVAVEGGDTDAYEEKLYGRTPDCWLIHANGHDFIYQRVPTGDESMLTHVYKVTQQGVVRITNKKPLGLAIKSDTTLNPDCLCMSLDISIYSRAVQMLPYAAYRVRDTGLPEMISDVYDLDGPWVRLRKSGRYNPDSRKNAAVSGGMWTLVAGERMRPYQTDLESWLDFITEDGRVVRFTIDRFADDMRLDSFGKLDDVFLPDESVG